MNCIEYKPTSKKEMNQLLDRSKKQEHPYYYRFQYSITEHIIVAARIRKDSLQISSNRQSFHCISIDENNSLHKAIKRKNAILNKFEKVEGNIVYAR